MLEFESENILVGTIIGSGRNLRYSIFAEGIEAREQLAFLRKHQLHRQAKLLDWEFAPPQ